MKSFNLFHIGNAIFVNNVPMNNWAIKRFETFHKICVVINQLVKCYWTVKFHIFISNFTKRFFIFCKYQSIFIQNNSSYMLLFYKKYVYPTKPFFYFICMKIMILNKPIECCIT